VIDGCGKYFRDVRINKSDGRSMRCHAQTEVGLEFCDIGRAE
jgi:hypothetical protein